MKQREQTTTVYRLAPPQSASIPHELFPLLPPNWPTEIPLARITTCGRDVSIVVLQRIESVPDAHPTLVYGPPDAALLAEKSATTALILLSVLASQPGCSATKDWLSETLGHLHRNEEDDDDDDLDERPGLKRVDNVVTLLRHLLFPPMLRDLPTANPLRRQLVRTYRATSESGPGYRLAGLPLLWLDVEAIGETIQQARALDQFGHDGLPAWQEAYALAERGVFLEREPYSDWASWRRQKVETQTWECVQILWRRLADQGESGETEAIRILQSYWQSHMTNEDSFRPLIELLGKRECYGQAEEYYAHLCLALEQEGKQPDHRTQEAMTFLRALRIQRKPLQHQSLVVTGEIARTSLDPSLTPDSTQQVTSLHMTQRESSSGLLKYSQEEMSQKEITRLLQELFSLSTEQVELLYLLDQRENKMAFNTSKRDTLRKIAAAFTIGPLAITDLEPWERLSMAQRASSPSPLLNATTLEHFQHLLSISWQLCNENQLVTAEEVLGSFLPQILSLHTHEPGTSLLAASGLYLQSMFAHHHLKLDDKVRLCEQSMSYAHEARDTDALVSALIELALAYEYTRQPEKRLAALQEALSFSGQASPLVQSLTYSEYAAALAENRRVREAQMYIDLAEKVFPDDPLKNAGFALSDSNIFCFSYRAGLVQISAGSISQAFLAFECYKQHRSGIGIPERLRLLIANGQSRAAILANDAERYAHLLEEVLVGAVRIGSQKRFDEALALFRQEMPTSWLSFSPIKHLSEHYDLKREA